MTSNIMLTLAFLAGVLAVYYLTPRAGRQWILLAASLLFYLSADPRLLLLAAGSALWSFGTGIGTEGAETKKGRKLWLAAAVLPVLLVLFVLKYFDFFAESVGSLLAYAGLSVSAPVLRLALPLGISYYTFKLISYNADIYLGKREAEKGISGCGAYLAYVLFFPQIVSGPIQRSEEFLSQLHAGPGYDSGLFAEGMQRIVLGLFKKMVIANRLSGYVDAVFGAPESYPGLACVMAAFFYSFQLYCDFPATRISLSAWEICWESVAEGILTVRIFPGGSRNSGAAGIFPFPAGSGTTSISLWAETGYRRSAGASMCWLSF